MLQVKKNELGTFDVLNVTQTPNKEGVEVEQSQLVHSPFTDAAGANNHVLQLNRRMALKGLLDCEANTEDMRICALVAKANKATMTKEQKKIVGSYDAGKIDKAAFLAKIEKALKMLKDIEATRASATSSDNVGKFNVREVAEEIIGRIMGLPGTLRYTAIIGGAAVAVAKANAEDYKSLHEEKVTAEEVLAEEGISPYAKAIVLDSVAAVA